MSVENNHVAPWMAAALTLTFWIASLFLPAFGMQFADGVALRWYDGWTMFFVPLLFQWFVIPSLFTSPMIFWFIAWWSNAALATALVQLIIERPTRLVWSACPSAMAVFAFAIRTFGLPDDSEMPVVAYGSGFWIWLGAMGLPLIYALSSRRPSSPDILHN